MLICYVDESGCTGVLPIANSPIQPVFCIAGLVLDQTTLRQLTLAFLKLKRQFFPNRLPTGTILLQWVLVEIKGSDLRSNVRGNRNERRHAIGFLDKVFDLLEACHARVFGRVWVKGIGAPFDGTAVYTSSIQHICRCFQNLLAAETQQGMVIADSRNKQKNTNVSHSVFTQKFQVAGDQYPDILEMVTFGHSDNHIGLQLSDLVCSLLLFPLATHAYCTGHVQNVHVNGNYQVLKSRFATRLKNLQYRYHDGARWRGGITVSDGIAQRSGSLLFT